MSAARPAIPTYMVVLKQLSDYQYPLLNEMSVTKYQSFKSMVSQQINCAMAKNDSKAVVAFLEKTKQLYTDVEAQSLQNKFLLEAVVKKNKELTIYLVNRQYGIELSEPQISTIFLEKNEKESFSQLLNLISKLKIKEEKEQNQKETSSFRCF